MRVGVLPVVRSEYQVGEEMGGVGGGICHVGLVRDEMSHLHDIFLKTWDLVT